MQEFKWVGGWWQYFVFMLDYLNGMCKFSCYEVENNIVFLYVETLISLCHAT
jgi:hypothetical protein